MSLITKDTFVSAHFIDQDRKNLEVLLNMDHTGELELTPMVIEADDSQPDFAAVLKLTTMDALHEETWAIKKAESEAFIATAKAVLSDSGVLDQEINLSKTKIFPTIVDNIFTNMTNEDHLFALKLALFELQEIRESDNIEAKTALRKGTNKIEILQHAFAITGVRETLGDAAAEITPDQVEAGLAAQEKQQSQESALEKKKSVMKNLKPATGKKAKVTKKK